MKDKVIVTVTNCCYYRGGGKGWNRKPYRIRKYQNLDFFIDEEKWKTYTQKQLLDYINGRFYHHGSLVWVMTTSKVKLKSQPSWLK